MSVPKEKTGSLKFHCFDRAPGTPMPSNCDWMTDLGLEELFGAESSALKKLNEFMKRRKKSKSETIEEIFKLH